MSCGDPHEIDCTVILEKVYLYLDSEMPDEDCASVRHHLDECAPCLREYGLEQAVKALVSRRCGGDVPADGLREQVLMRLRTVAIETEHVEFRVD